MESSDGVRATFEGRGGYHFQVIARGERDDLLLADELGDAGEVGLNGGLQLIAAGVVLGYFLQHFLDDQILPVGWGEIRVVVVVRIHLCVQGQRDLQHFGAHGLHVLLGAGQHFRGGDGSFHHQRELLIVEFLAQAPGEIRRLLGERILQPCGEIMQRFYSGRGDGVVFGLQRRACGNFRSERMFDEFNVAGIFFDGCGNPHGIGVGQVRLHLREEARNLANA